MISWLHKSQQAGDQGGVDFTLSPPRIVGTNSGLDSLCSSNEIQINRVSFTHAHTQTQQ